MGLFSKKKEVEVKTELPPLKFPELPPEEHEPTPTETEALKQAVSPVSLPPVSMPRETSRFEQNEEKPLFVKVEKYREVMVTLNELKNKLKDAGDLLVELNKIKEQEERELSAWQDDLNAIKEKLINIDRTLFEL
ncbi:MAG: hypothetical protein PHO02_03650 [Candidatus Nanoarchaeia archaeon]|nr:hypothetical protein [Candidatus Nanoarchaeia archaeon]